MDENKRDELQPEEAEVQLAEETAAEEVAENENGLAQELEELRDMFQQELDKATEEAENQTQTLIQELDEIEDTQDEDAEEEFTGRLCEICGEHPCAEEYGEDYPYCQECRNLMKKYPMRASGILMSILMIAVFAVTGYAGSSYLESFMSIAENAAYYDTGKVLTALNGYYSYNMSADPATISMKAAV